MLTTKCRFWTSVMTLATAVVFGLSIFLAPPALAGGRGREGALEGGSPGGLRVSVGALMHGPSRS